MRSPRWTILRAPEDGSGGGAAAAGGGAARAADAAGGGAAASAERTEARTEGNGQSAGAQAAQAGAAAANAAGGYRPENLPDHLFGKDDRETIDKLHKSVDGFRKAQGERGEVPADAKGYTFTPSDVVKPYAAALDKDPFFDKVRGFAHSSGISTKQFDAFLNGVLGEMVAGQMVDQPFSAEREREALLPDVKDAKERATLADRMSSEAIARVKAWQEQGLAEPIAKDLLSRMDRASTIQLVNWVAARGRETGPAMGGTADGKAVTPAQLRERQADPRNDPNSAKYEKSFVEETDRLYKLAYPGPAER